MSTTKQDVKPARRGLWSRAEEMALKTPENRNRYVDLLRAVSIGVVVFGHWLMAAPHLTGGRPQLDHLLDVSQWTQWLTWIFQVMPVFFIVGGFSNGTSWDSAQRKGTGYGPWLHSRLQRLLGPVLPLLITWTIMAAVAHSQGVPAGMIRIGSQVALVPVWFLAVYILVVIFVPISRAAWRRWQMNSFWSLVAAAVVVDVAFFVAGLHWLGWVNYLFIWSAVHQLGYAWNEGRFEGFSRAVPWFLAGTAALVLLTHLGPYPLSLVGVPSDGISNTLPPKLPLLALAAAQLGLLLAVEKPMRRWLGRLRVWTATVLVNGMIMTIFLWHSTVMMLLIGLAFWVLPAVLTVEPGSSTWWAFRPLWIAVYAVSSLPFIAVFARFERPSTKKEVKVPHLWRLLAGCAVTCAGLALLALGGVGGGDGWFGLRVVPLLLPFIGADLAGFGPLSSVLSGRRSPSGGRQ